MIDEVDSASNYQVFLDFLAQMRLLYIHKDDYKVFQSVIAFNIVVFPYWRAFLITKYSPLSIIRFISFKRPCKFTI